MALIKFINGKNRKTAGLARAIDYVLDKNKTERFLFEDINEKDIPKNQIDNEMLFVEKLLGDETSKGDRAINYITKDSKTNPSLVSGFNCLPSSAFDEMMVVKNMYNKTGGRQFVHFVQSFHPKEDITPELAHKIGLELLEDERFKDFQIVVATHVDKEHIHNHFILNTVNIETGRKWRQSNIELEQLKYLSNKLCYKYGLQHSITNTKTNKFINREYMSSGEYRARKKGRSWKYEAWLAINECMKISTSKEEFIEILENIGYKVRWEDNRKNITFILPNGRKLNNDKLHPSEKYTKEALIKKFQLNKQFQERNIKFKAEKKSQDIQNLILETIRRLERDPELGDKNYPLTYLEGQALKEKMIEKAKGEGLDWEKERQL